jgi:hypothetical protein
MFQEVLRSADWNEVAVVRRRLARERAGLEAAPRDASQLSPYEELMRLLVGLGDELERDLAGQLGPRVARALRKRSGGWPGEALHMVGCPE